MTFTWITDLIEAMFTPFSTVITSILGGLKDGFETVIFADPLAVEKTVSTFGIFAFVLLGVALAIGITKYITSLIKK